MPVKNVRRSFVSNAYYHVYNRGMNFGNIFCDSADYEYFEHLLESHLSPKPFQSRGKIYKHYYPAVHLNSYCLLNNHFHMLLYQYEETAVSQLMTSLITAYTAYFNKKHKRRGSLFESTFKAVQVYDDSQLQHITRYIHLNHPKYKVWTHSSYRDYLGAPKVWVDSKPILDLFNSASEYEQFVADYEDTKREHDEIKKELYGYSASNVDVQD